MTFEQTLQGVVLTIKVIPKASQTAFAGIKNDVLRIRVKAIPEKGKANIALIAFLSETFRIAKERVRLLSGASGRHKRVLLLGCKLEEILAQCPKEQEYEESGDEGSCEESDS